MATSTVMNSQLQLVLENGTDEKGNPILKNKNFNNVKTDATPDQLWAVANALVALQQHPLYAVERNDSKELQN
ncbi:DUF1659 domain-containing protein [Pontibacillus salicampi]|uniref:DUF1659 domain-containing protein n=1 Tax=Pontibacillus salicampi TaxID=1449801 RepID=A0ABV6LIT2_9BACI